MPTRGEGSVRLESLTYPFERAYFCESAEMAECAESASCFWPTRAWRICRHGGSFCRVTHCVAYCIFGDTMPKSLSGLELPCRCQRREATPSDMAHRLIEASVGARCDAFLS